MTHRDANEGEAVDVLFTWHGATFTNHHDAAAFAIMLAREAVAEEDSEGRAPGLYSLAHDFFDLYESRHPAALGTILHQASFLSTNALRAAREVYDS